MGLKRAKGAERQSLLERLQQLGAKARRNPKSLTTAELGELCDIVEALRPHERDMQQTPYG